MGAISEQTDDVKITFVVRAQRVRGAGSRIEMQAGKWITEGAGKGKAITHGRIRE